MESLTVHYLARELHDAWSGRRIACFAMVARPAAVVLGAAGGPTVGVDLSRPDVRVRHSAPARGREPLDGYEIVSVAAPTDERRLEIRLTKPGKFRGSASREAVLTISLIPNARGAVLATREGHRFATIGSAVPPVHEPRPVLDAAQLRAAAASGDQALLLRGRWIGVAVAHWLLAAPDEIVERYERIAALPPARPSRCGGTLLPLPLCDDPTPADSLIEPAEAAAAERSATDSQAADPRRRAIARMREQLDRAGEAPRLRAAADALLALADGATVPSRVTLPDGSSVMLAPRTGEPAAALAERLYAKARAMDRARATLPDRIARLESEADERPNPPGRRAAATRPTAEPRRSYKRFASRGGLEIRVGRSAAENDVLTFHESSPDDVWLHAQGVSGSHVVLRWSRDEAPPAADLEDAALLAAWHSRARGSTVIPVNWTRRRYVRKPRGAAAGSVLVSRSETVFVRPTAAAVRAIRDRS